jgi:hypothetical protein
VKDYLDYLLECAKEGDIESGRLLLAWLRFFSETSQPELVLYITNREDE